jgi:hypothetical protein
MVQQNIVVSQAVVVAGNQKESKDRPRSRYRRPEGLVNIQAPLTSGGSRT